MKRTWTILLLTAALLLSVLAGCGGGDTAGDSGARELVFAADGGEGMDPGDGYQGWACIRNGVGETLFRLTDELEAEMPDDMLRRSAAAAFQNRVEKLDPELYAIITDSAAFTLYILNDRQTGNDRCGEVLAELCDRDGDQELIDSGNALAAEYRRLFSGIIQSYTFK